MATWRRCEKCRKVLSANSFDGSAAMCTPCLTAPVRAPRATTAVTTRRVAPAADPAAGPAPASAGAPATVVDRSPRQGVVGRGDPELRARRARARALQELSDLHADDFERLLGDARRAEGLM